MSEYTKLPLLTKNRSHFYINQGRLDYLKKDLEEFLKDQDYMLSKSFAQDVLFNHEVKFNNAVEEYNDDIDVVEETILHSGKKNKTEKERRILNLYKGYRYIFEEEQEINQDTLKVLYQKLSRRLLDPYDLERMGEFYRNDPVYIFYSMNMNTPPAEGLDAAFIQEYMNYYFEFIQNYPADDATAEYIKSQIMHFYFVYIHPYYDVNGRTSRTVSMWYLLNKEIYPYIIFNRGITLKKNNYYKVIRTCYKKVDVTPFVEYMLKNVFSELQKEYVIHQIREKVSISSLEHQTLQYILSLNSLKTVGDFRAFYNFRNEKKSSKDIFETMILPLLEKDILTIDRVCNSKLQSDFHNFLFSLNTENFDIEKEKVRLLKI